MESETVRFLKGYIPAGAEVATTVRKTGTTHRVRVLIVHDGRIADVTQYAAAILPHKLVGDEMSVRGTGFSAGSHVVAGLAKALYGDAQSLVAARL